LVLFQITFSSSHDVVAHFTRDLDLIRSKLTKIEEGDEAHIDLGLAAVSKLVVGEWGILVPCNVVLFTDGTPGAVNMRSSLPFPFPGKLHVVSLGTPSNSSLAVYHRCVLEVLTYLNGHVNA